MKRMTIGGGGCAEVSTKSCFGYENCFDCPQYKRMVDRLAAYEDTGLEPDTVSKIRDVVLDIHGEIDHLRELVQAERDGRLVVLAVRPGLKPTTSNMVYIVDDGEVRTDFVLCAAIGEDEAGKLVVEYETDDTVFYDIDIGKCVFLTEAEAKAALEREKGGDDNG